MGQTKDNIKMDLKEVCCDTRNWIDLAEDGLMTGLHKGGNKPPGSLRTNQ